MPDWPFSILLSLTTIAVAAILWSAGILKARNVSHFEFVLRTWRIVPEAWVGPLARVIPFAEMGLAVGLLATLVPYVPYREIRLLAGLLLLVFVVG